MNKHSKKAQAIYQKKVAKFTETGETLTEEQEAILFAQSVYMQFINAPQSAVFPPFEDFTVKGSNGNYTISGCVEAKNLYGGPVNMNFKFKVVKKNGVWSTPNSMMGITMGAVMPMVRAVLIGLLIMGGLAALVAILLLS